MFHTARIDAIGIWMDIGTYILTNTRIVAEAHLLTATDDDDDNNDVNNTIYSLLVST